MAKARTKKAPAKKPAARKSDPIATTTAHAQADRQARLDELVGLVKQRMTDVVASFWDIGAALSEVRRDKLYKVERHTTFEAFLSAHDLPGKTQAARLIAVARKTPRAVAIHLGQEKTYALLGFADATPEADTPADLVDGRKVFGGKTAAQASVRDIEQATREQHAKNAAAAPRTKAQRAKEKADAALTKRVATELKGTGLPKATVTVVGGVVRAEWPRARLET